MLYRACYCLAAGNEEGLQNGYMGMGMGLQWPHGDGEWARTDHRGPLAVEALWDWAQRLFFGPLDDPWTYSLDPLGTWP